MGKYADVTAGKWERECGEEPAVRVRARRWPLDAEVAEETRTSREIELRAMRK